MWFFNSAKFFIKMLVILIYSILIQMSAEKDHKQRYGNKKK